MRYAVKADYTGAIADGWAFIRDASIQAGVIGNPESPYSTITEAIADGATNFDLESANIGPVEFQSNGTYRFRGVIGSIVGAITVHPSVTSPTIVIESDDLVRFSAITLVGADGAFVEQGSFNNNESPPGNNGEHATIKIRNCIADSGATITVTGGTASRGGQGSDSNTVAPNGGVGGNGGNGTILATNCRGFVYTLIGGGSGDGGEGGNGLEGNGDPGPAGVSGQAILNTEWAEPETEFVENVVDEDYILDTLGITQISGVNSGDNAINSRYHGLVSNVTHTGDAEGSGALTVKGINGVSLAGLATGILKNTTTTGVPSIAVAGTDYVAPNGVNSNPTISGSVRHTEIVLTPSGASPSQTITLDSGNAQTLNTTSASGTIAVTLTRATASYMGRIVVKVHATTPTNITWAVSAGTLYWLGTQPTWTGLTVSKRIIVTVTCDGTDTYLAATEVNS